MQYFASEIALFFELGPLEWRIFSIHKRFSVSRERKREREEERKREREKKRRRGS